MYRSSPVMILERDRDNHCTRARTGRDSASDGLVPSVHTAVCDRGLGACGLALDGCCDDACVCAVD